MDSSSKPDIPSEPDIPENTVVISDSNDDSDNISYELICLDPEEIEKEEDCNVEKSKICKTMTSASEAETQPKDSEHREKDKKAESVLPEIVADESNKDTIADAEKKDNGITDTITSLAERLHNSDSQLTEIFPESEEPPTPGEIKDINIDQSGTRENDNSDQSQTRETVELRNQNVLEAHIEGEELKVDEENNKSKVEVSAIDENKTEISEDFDEEKSTTTLQTDFLIKAPPKKFIPPISEQINILKNCFSSTDSDSDCDRLVLDCKTESSERESDVDHQGNKKCHPVTTDGILLETKEVYSDKNDVKIPSEPEDHDMKSQTNPTENPVDSQMAKDSSSSDVEMPTVRTEPNMETEEESSEFSGMTIIPAVQITREEFEQIQTEDDPSFAPRPVTSGEDESISESEVQPVSVKSSESMKVTTAQQTIITPAEPNITKLASMVTKIKKEPVDEGYSSALGHNTPNMVVEVNGKSASKLLPRQPTSMTSSAVIRPSQPSIESRDQSMIANVRKFIESNTNLPPGCKIVKINSNSKASVQNIKVIPQKPEYRTIAKKPVQTIGATKILRITKPAQASQAPVAAKNNTDSFDIASVTEILQRKHKIGNHKAPPIPEKFKNYLRDLMISSCLECGDSFTTREMLAFHRKRVSVEISYKCPGCMQTVIFYNKCSFLHHIRMHNMDNTHKNPAIQVKADILSIRLAPTKMILDMLETPISPIEILDNKESKSTAHNPGSCTECGKRVESDAVLADHFGRNEMLCTYVHVCNMCNMVLPRGCALEAHNRYHSVIAPYTCPECGLVMEDFEEFRKHLHVTCFHFSRVGELSCKQLASRHCDYTDIRLNSFASHIENEHMTPMNHTFITKNPSGAEMTKTLMFLSCSICNTVLRNTVKIGKHKNVHLKDAKRNSTYGYVCTECPMVNGQQGATRFRYKWDLEEHYKSAHFRYITHFPKKDVWNCSVCASSFKSYSKFLSHQLQVHEMINAEVYFCKRCKAMFEHPEALLKHSCEVDARMGQKYLLKIAPKPPNFQDKDTIRSPPQAVMKSPPKPTGKSQAKSPVKIQPKPASKPQVSAIKLASKPQAESHECSFCHKEFKSAGEKERHVALEHNSFSCHLCGLTYLSSQDLADHFRSTHEGTKPGYFCFPCKKKGIARSFGKEASLEKHLIFKHRVAKARLRRYMVIGKENSKSNETVKRRNSEESEAGAVKRLRVDGSGAYACVKCNFNTEDAQEFNAHIETHKAADSNQCPECGLCFSVLPSLKKHLFMVHKIRNGDEYLKSHDIREPEEMALDDEDEIEVTISPRKTPFTNIAPIEPVRKKEGPVGELECRVCYREFESVNLLKNHMRVHGMAFIRSRRFESASVEIKTERDEQSN